MSHKKPATNSKSTLSQVKRALIEKRLQGNKLQASASKILPRCPDANTMPLSYGQERLWFLNQFEPESLAYNRPVPILFTGSLDVPVLERCINEIIRRHEILRTRIHQKDGGPVQIITPPRNTPLFIADLRNQVSPIELGALAKKRVLEAARWKFDLSKGPPIRVQLLKLQKNQHILLVTMHHIIFDGWSQGILYRELASLYKTFLQEKPSKLPQLPIQYGDFAIWQRKWLNGGELKPHISYWREALHGLPALSALSTDYPRPAVQTHTGAVESQLWPTSLLKELRDLSRQEQVSLFMTLLAGFNVLFFRYTGQEDIILGTPIAGRNRVETEDLIGLMINTLPIRTNLSENLTFHEILTRVRETTLGAYAHQDLPFEKLVEELNPERSISYSPFFQILFQLRNYSTKKEHLPDLEFTEFEIDLGTVAFDLEVDLTEEADALRCRIKYNTALYDSCTIIKLLTAFHTLLKSIVTHPNQPIANLQILAEAEKHQILDEWNNTQEDFPEDQSIYQLFEEQVKRRPNSIALHYENQCINYKKLDVWASRLAYHLDKLGVKPGILVGVCIDRSPAMVVSLLGILKCGGAYVPLDPTYPHDRLVYMLKDSGLKIVVCNKKYSEFLRKSVTDVKLAIVEETQAEVAHYENKTFEKPSAPIKAETVYVIYTSGSTGKPKGVLGTTNGLLNRLRWTWSEYPYSEGEVCCQKTSLNFVDHVAEIFSPLLKGVPLVLLKENDVRDIGRLMTILSKKMVTRIVLVPSLLRAILQNDMDMIASLHHLKYWFCSGESLTVAQARQFYERIPEGILFNIYGSTEIGADATCYRLERGHLSSLMHYFLQDDEIRNSDLGQPIEDRKSNRVTTPGISVDDLKENFKEVGIPKHPVTLDSYYDSLNQNVFPYIVNTASPRFIGHMTSALPSFTHDLNKLISRLNQNIVKVETSKSLSFLERQTIAMIHREFYNCPSEFYENHTQNVQSGLGVIVSGGTLANLTALWCARNSSLAADGEFKGISKSGLQASLQYYNHKRIVIVATRSAHYSIRKAASLLGLGTENIVYVEQTKSGRLDISSLKRCIHDCNARGDLIMAMIGLAGATETGCIDPLEDMADIASKFGIFFHVDAAWGGPVIFSDKHRSLLSGIHRADSITICGHKQLYLPLGLSLCVFRDPHIMNRISMTAHYQATRNSYDSGKRSPEGSRPALFLCLHAALNLIGKSGYEKLINDGIEKAQYLRNKILNSDAFELIGNPPLNILNYRYIPKNFREKLKNRDVESSDNDVINKANTILQERQFYEGQSFVSKTTLFHTSYGASQKIVVLRAVLANPLTTFGDIDFVLKNQLDIADRIIEMEKFTPKDEITLRGGGLPQEIVYTNRKGPNRKNYVRNEVFEKMTVPIGKPIMNMRVYILDKKLNPVPIGVPGEIFVAGIGLASGYLNRPVLTKNKFIPDPFSNDPAGRLFQTGDLGRYRRDGNIEFLGRSDQQVKIRGFRIEMGEIESALEEHPLVQEAVVIAREENPGDQQLVAYLIPKGKPPSTALLRKILKNKLPEFMIPSAYIVLEQFPLTPNGKVNRKALPTPTIKRLDNVTFIAPRNEIEKFIANVWKELLHVDTVGVNDNFFDLGGHSLLLTKVQNKLRNYFSMALTIVDLFRYPTIGKLSNFLAQGQTDRIKIKDRNILSKDWTRQRDRLSTEETSESTTVNSTDDIAIIGLAGRFPGAMNIDEFWSNLCDGVESIEIFSDEELLSHGVNATTLNDPNYIKAGTILQDCDKFDAAFFGLSPREAELTDPQQRLFLEVSWEALENAGYDPESYKGSIGVFAGGGMNRYSSNLYLRERTGNLVSDFQKMIGNERDFLTTRVSYCLNLRGPSVTVQTACSTSLVAVHLACENLLAKRCDMALAGGVSVRLPQGQGYYYQEGMIRSPDGHCRVFDANGQGVVFGSGLGIVVLKQLHEALADGDTIHAVIKGSAVNNDGANKIGYTAPGVDGQVEAITKALARGKVDPNTISYVEAHGTGTALGDPIEITALTEAFSIGAKKKGFCAIGSVKTNVGHLDAAAGVTGLIKTILALEKKKIPASLNFKTPNPKIDFANSPFYVNTKLREWKTTGSLRRAGVSSFGIGGTNAHLVLEEFPQLKCSEQSRSPQLLMFSAKTNSAFNALVTNFIKFLKQHPCINLADVAYTLQIGRRGFNRRWAVTVQGIGDAIATLETSSSTRIPSNIKEDMNPDVVFMFPGQGSAYITMGFELYRSEQEFKKHIDYCSDVLLTHLDADIRDILYPDETGAEAAIQHLRNPIYYQPILFVTEYALAKMWMAWGVQPAAMVGHGIGEYVAACLAGVFTLKDALYLVAAKGRLIQGLPRGSMMSVSLSEAQLFPSLNNKLSLAAVNSNSICVVAGEESAIVELEEQLHEKDVFCHHLQTSHAFHSRMMEPIGDALTDQIKDIDLNPPQIPIISTVTGTWIDAGQMTDPRYWIKNLRQTVRFAECAGKLMKNTPRILLEVGPGQTLCDLVRQHDHKPAEQILISSLPNPKQDKRDVALIFDSLGQLWMAGVTIDWSAFYVNEKRRRVPLPTYPFKRQRYWIEREETSQINPSRPSQTTKRVDLDEWFYIPSWNRTLASFDWSNELSWLVFSDNSGLGAPLVRRLRDQRCSVTVVVAGKRFRKDNSRSYVINPQSQDDYLLLFRHLGANNILPDTIAHLWGVSKTNEAFLEEIHNPDLTFGFYSLIFLAQAWYSLDDSASTKISVVTNNVQEVNSQDTLTPEKATVLGPIKVIPQEYGNITCQNIDVNLVETKNWQGHHLDALISEMASAPSDSVVAYRGNHRMVRTYVQCQFNSRPVYPSLLRDKGVYLITGGLGNIGIALAEFLVRTVDAKLILVGRSEFPDRKEWNTWLSKPDNKFSHKIRKVGDLERLGGEIFIVRADVANLKQMRNALAQAEDKFGEIHGVIHAAGVVDVGSSSVIQKLNYQACERQFRPKIEGVKVLSEALAGKELDFCLLTSSLASILGGLGYSTYAAANRFMDAFIYEQNRACEYPWICVNWDAWRFEKENGQLKSHLKQLAMTSSEGVETFAKILSIKMANQIIVSTGHLEDRIQQWITLNPLADKKRPHANEKSEELSPSYHRPSALNDYVAPRSQAERTLATLWQDLLGISKVGIHDNYFELGGDSLLGMNLVARAKQCGITLLPHDLFENPTIAKLSSLISSSPANNAEQGLVTGPLTLIPAMCRFLYERKTPNPHHWNLSSLVASTQPLNSDLLKQVVTHMLEHHDVLRLRCYYSRGSWHADIIDCGGEIPFSTIDLTGLSEGQQRDVIETTAADMQSSLNLSKGPLLRVVHFNLGLKSSHRLLVIAHHFVMEGMSWVIFWEDLESAYKELSQGESISLPQKTTSYKRWAESLDHYAQSDELKKELSYWTKLPWEKIRPLPTDFPVEEMANNNKSACEVTVSFSVDKTHALVHNPLKNFNPEDVLLTALAQVIGRWTGSTTVLVDKIGHGRNVLPNHIDTIRTLGFFIAYIPLVLELGLRDSHDTLASISSQLHSIPNSGGGYDLLRFLSNDKDVRNELNSYPRAEILFNFRGKLANPYSTSSLFLQASESSGSNYDSNGIRQHPLSIVADIRKNRLEITFVYSKNLHKRSTIGRLTDEFVKEVDRWL